MPTQCEERRRHADLQRANANPRNYGAQHKRIACGRGYGDVAPVQGVCKGPARQRLWIDVSARKATDGDGREQLSENKLAAPEPPTAVERAQQPAQQQLLADWVYSPHQRWVRRAASDLT